MEVWEGNSKALARKRKDWLGTKKLLELKLSEDKRMVEVLKWVGVKTELDAKSARERVRNRVVPDGSVYDTAVSWFLGGYEFLDWCKDIQSVSENGRDAKKALWVKGVYGSGKTTLMYVVSSVD